MSKIICGVQLYTLRKYLNKVDNISAVLRRVKEMGAQTVQVSGMCPIDAKLLDKYTRDNQLSICCTHSPFNRIKNDIDRLAEEHLIYGCDIIGLGMMPKSYREDNFKRIDEFIDILNEASYKLKQYNINIAYHNHAFEFHKVKEEKVYDLLIDKTDNAVQFILDTYWVRFAGESIIDYVSRLNNRLPVLHLKDYKKVLFLPLMSELGRGEIDFVEILKTAENNGVRYAVIEQDFSFNPYKSVGISMNYLKDNYIGIE